MSVKGYNHMALQVSDLDQAERFYAEGLQLPKLPRPEFGVPGLWFQVGEDAMLHLVALDGGPREVRRLPHVALSTDRQHLEELVKSLQAIDAQEVAALVCRTESGVEEWSATFADPDGNAVELTTAQIPR